MILKDQSEANQITVVTHWEYGSVKVFAPERGTQVRMIRADDPEQRFAERAEADIIERDQHLIGQEEA
tara:strand:- start:338 stop:541 length:204 start_codon:yes stop_codon:yes gene_type:complete